MNTAILTLKEFEELTWESYQELVNKLTTIDKSKIEKELEELPRIYTIFSGLAAKAKEAFTQAELDAELKLANLKEEARVKIELEKKRATKEFVESVAMKDAAYYSITIKTNRKEAVYTSLKGILQGLMIKRDCLVQLSANARGEMNMYQ